MFQSEGRWRTICGAVCESRISPTGPTYGGSSVTQSFRRYFNARAPHLCAAASASADDCEPYRSNAVGDAVASAILQLAAAAVSGHPAA